MYQPSLDDHMLLSLTQNKTLQSSTRWVYSPHVVMKLIKSELNVRLISITTQVYCAEGCCVWDYYFLVPLHYIHPKDVAIVSFLITYLQQK